MNPVKYIALLLLLAAAGNTQSVKPEIRYFHYERKIQNTPPAPGQACFAVGPAIFNHAAPALADLRIYRGTVEKPYVLRKVKPAASPEKKVVLMNLGRRDGHTVFDVAMPAGEYSDIQLLITGQNFIATVEVSGSQTEAGTRQTNVGSFTIFDLTRQKLGRSTVLHLPKSNFRFLHFRIDGPIEPQNVKGLTVMRVVASKSKYVTVAASSNVVQEGRDSVIRFTVPANTPVDRVVFVPGVNPRDFSRTVRVHVEPIKPSRTTRTAGQLVPAASSGNILRIHRVEQRHRLNEERLSVSAPKSFSGTTMWRVLVEHWTVPTVWTVRIENGDDTPISLRSVRLEMVERDLCFHAAGGSGYTLYYGDSALNAPQYDYAKLFTPKPDAVTANLGPEVANPAYQSRPDMRPFTEKHPALLWIALVLAILSLAAIALRSARHTKPNA